MNDTPVELDKHRGMAAQKATDIRCLFADVDTVVRLESRKPKALTFVRALSNTN